MIMEIIYQKCLVLLFAVDSVLCSFAGEKCPVLAMGTAVGNSDVWFRFNEGMSNAVRRNIYIRELL